MLQRFTNVVLSLALLALLVTNILTLVSRGFHETAYDLLAMGIGAGAFSYLLANSPTAAARQLADANTQLTRKHAALQARVSRRSAALKRFQMSTVKRIGRNVAVEVASLPERALPIIGVAALIGTTAYEIHSGCEMLKELNTVLAEHELEPANESSVCGITVPTTAQVWDGVKSRTFSIVHRIRERLTDLF
jgi:hypothetical protein